MRRTARAGSGSLAIETGASTTRDVRGHVADLGGGAEQDHVDARDVRGTARDLSGTEIGPVDVYRDGDGRALVLVIVIVRVVHVHDLATAVEPAMRADAMRAAGPAALWAAVDRGRGDLVLRPALCGARVRLLLLRDGHGGEKG